MKKGEFQKKCFICGDVIELLEESKGVFHIGKASMGGYAHGKCIKELATCLRWQILMIDLDINLRNECKYKKLGDNKLLIDVGDDRFE